jgi:tRNA 2-thiouridine synthesizing protein A
MGAAETPSSAIEVAGSYDAGDLGCGEIAMELRRRMLELAGGQVLHVRATDLGMPEDLPAWCRLTRHRLIAASPPEYWIERRED